MLLNKLTSVQLKDELRRRGLPSDGNKNELLIRLRGALIKDGMDPETIRSE